ncbi:hypothetical protein [Bacillus infantis]|jgi:hypothetical protein|uniref:hypothetical protein n=1 Tax=Bacillus infantis TaxID=324767 RepID=UPI002155AAF1|nr:hypothetical protein [Bacillus infantis]MCR6612841.1 hypothetical protein [Bacillus infantis]
MFNQLAEQLSLFIFIIALIPMMYALVFYRREKDERGQAILAKAYQYAYSFLVVGLLVLYIISQLTGTDLSFENFRLAIVYILLAGNALLGILLFILNRKY